MANKNRRAADLPRSPQLGPRPTPSAETQLAIGNNPVDPIRLLQRLVNDLAIRTVVEKHMLEIVLEDERARSRDLQSELDALRGKRSEDSHLPHDTAATIPGGVQSRDGRNPSLGITEQNYEPQLLDSQGSDAP